MQRKTMELFNKNAAIFFFDFISIFEWKALPFYDFNFIDGIKGR